MIGRRQVKTSGRPSIIVIMRIPITGWVQRYFVSLHIGRIASAARPWYLDARYVTQRRRKALPGRLVRRHGVVAQRQSKTHYQGMLGETQSNQRGLAY